MDSSNLFVVPEECEYETRNSTADKQQESAKHLQSKPQQASNSKENKITEFALPEKPRTAGNKIPSASSGIGKGVSKILKDQKVAQNQKK